MENAQRRWECYAKFIVLVRSGLAQKGDVDAKELEPLHLSRNRLAQIMKLVGDKGIPAECPPAFRTGRAPALQLTEAESTDFLNYILYYAKTGRAMSVSQCQSLCHVRIMMWFMR